METPALPQQRICAVASACCVWCVLATAIASYVSGRHAGPDVTPEASSKDFRLERSKTCHLPQAAAFEEGRLAEAFERSWTPAPMTRLTLRISHVAESNCLSSSRSQGTSGLHARLVPPRSSKALVVKPVERGPVVRSEYAAVTVSRSSGAVNLAAAYCANMTTSLIYLGCAANNRPCSNCNKG